MSGDVRKRTTGTQSRHRRISERGSSLLAVFAGPAAAREAATSPVRRIAITAHTAGRPSTQSGGDLSDTSLSDSNADDGNDSSSPVEITSVLKRRLKRRRQHHTAQKRSKDGKYFLADELHEKACREAGDGETIKDRRPVRSEAGVISMLAMKQTRVQAAQELGNLYVGQPELRRKLHVLAQHSKHASTITNTVAARLHETSLPRAYSIVNAEIITQISQFSQLEQRDVDNAMENVWQAHRLNVDAQLALLAQLQNQSKNALQQIQKAESDLQQRQEELRLLYDQGEVHERLRRHVASGTPVSAVHEYAFSPPEPKGALRVASREVVVRWLQEMATGAFNTKETL